MGNYQNTINRIAQIEERISSLCAEREGLTDEDERFALSEHIWDLEVEKGECEGYLEELASMDGYQSYSEMCEDCFVE